MLHSLFFLQTLLFNSTNIRHLSQLNALGGLRRLDVLTVEEDGNPVTELHLWKTYLLFRLAHFGLKKINNQDVSSSMFSVSFKVQLDLIFLVFRLKKGVLTLKSLQGRALIALFKVQICFALQ